MVNPEIRENLARLFLLFIERAVRTFRGSADDIGWPQHEPGMRPVKDGTYWFNKIMDGIMRGKHSLPKTLVYLLVPGLFSNHIPLYFVDTKKYLSDLGLECHIMEIHSESSVENNARKIKEYIEELCWGSNKRVVILGHSKGGIDAAAALSLYWPDLKDKVVGLVVAQSPYGGNPIASDLLRKGQFGFRKIVKYIMSKMIKGDIKALEDLTYERRKEFLKNHPLPQELPTVSFCTEASSSPEDLTNLSLVAEKFPGLPYGIPMAASAQWLQVRYGEKSDGVVTCRDAEVPGSVVVRPERKLDHTWLVFSTVNEDPSGEADPPQVNETLLTMVLSPRKHRSPKRVVLDLISKLF